MTLCVVLSLAYAIQLRAVNGTASIIRWLSAVVFMAVGGRIMTCQLHLEDPIRRNRTASGPVLFISSKPPTAKAGAPFTSLPFRLVDRLSRLSRREDPPTCENGRHERRDKAILPFVPALTELDTHRCKTLDGCLECKN
jgi:hypothetical protein